MSKPEANYPGEASSRSSEKVRVFVICTAHTWKTAHWNYYGSSTDKYWRHTNREHLLNKIYKCNIKYIIQDAKKKTTTKRPDAQNMHKYGWVMHILNVQSDCLRVWWLWECSCLVYLCAPGCSRSIWQKQLKERVSWVTAVLDDLFNSPQAPFQVNVL